MNTFIGFQCIFGTLHNFPYILLMSAINLGYLSAATNAETAKMAVSIQLKSDFGLSAVMTLDSKHFVKGCIATCPHLTRYMPVFAFLWSSKPIQSLRERAGEL